MRLLEIVDATGTEYWVRPEDVREIQQLYGPITNNRVDRDGCQVYLDGRESPIMTANNASDLARDVNEHGRKFLGGAL